MVFDVILLLAISALYLFVIIYFAVRCAIGPLIHKSDKSPEDYQELNLKKLHEVGLLTDDEYYEIVEIYRKQDIEREETNQYNDYANILMELKDKGYISLEKYNEKFERLIRHYKEG